MTETTNDEQSRYAWARRPTTGNEAEADVPQGYGVPEGHLEPEQSERPEYSGSDAATSDATAPLAGGAYPTAPTQPVMQPAAPYAAPPQSWASPRGGAYPAPAAPTATEAPPAPADPTAPVPPGSLLPAGPVQSGNQPGSHPGASFGYPSANPATAHDPGGPSGPYPPVPTQRDPRRPGWGGVVAIGVGAAVLSALLTAGLINATSDESSTATSSATNSQSSVPAPVKTSTVSNPDWASVARAVEPSVVAVQVTSQSGEGEGSGVILNKNGEIVTNNHVVAGAGDNGTVKVVLNDGRSYDATVVGTDSQTDLAVIKLKNPPSDLVPAALGSSADVGVGDPVMAVGNPLGLAGTVTTGIVSATDRPTTTTSSEGDSQNPFGQTSSDDVVITVPAALGSSADVGVGDPVMAVGNPLGLAGTVTTGIVSATDRPTTTTSSEGDSQNPFGQTSSDDVVITNAIQTDAAVNPGNSGGALVDVQGRVIGIPSSIASLGSSSSSSQSGSIGLGFAIPIDEVKTVADQLAKGETVQHSYLGVSLTEGSVQVDGAGRDAAIVASVVSGGPAAKAGLEKGDGVIAVDGESVNSYTSLVGQLREREPGASVKLTVVRDGKSQDITVALGTKPSTQS